MNDKMSVADQIKKSYTQMGFSFLLFGIAEVACLLLKDFGMVGSIARLVSSILMLSALLLLNKSMNREKELFDELAEENLLQAKSETIRRVKFVLIGLAMVVIVLDMVEVFVNVNLKMNLTPYEVFMPLAYILIGYIDISIGYYFRKYEEE